MLYLKVGESTLSKLSDLKTGTKIFAGIKAMIFSECAFSKLSEDPNKEKSVIEKEDIASPGEDKMTKTNEGKLKRQVFELDQ